MKNFEWDLFWFTLIIILYLMNVISSAFVGNVSALCGWSLALLWYVSPRKPLN